ncbi:MAG TPA: sulfatase-like hydrolase/transferase [Candidatus Polarisedimenticolia bacterium]|nr:sulfatase-like hydrolase/transferase [Candidatus Polarisedimenticolia bacterium]
MSQGRKLGKLLGLVCLSLAVLSLPGGNASAALQDSKRNVLVIVADDFGVDQLQRYVDHFGNILDAAGHRIDAPDTPNIDRLADAGVSFENVWSSPVCSASRAGLLTGTYSVHNSIFDVVLKDTPGMSTSMITIAEALSATKGYHSALFGKWHLGTNLPTDQGFEVFKGAMDAALDDYYMWEKRESVHRYDSVLHKVLVGDWTIPKPTSKSNDNYATFVNVDDASSWILDQTGSWMAVVAFNAPHLTTTKILDGQDPPTDGVCVGTGETMDEAVIYPAMIECMDAYIGELLERIHDKLSKTTIIFVGDNGTDSTMTSFQAFKGLHGKESVYEGGVAVPMIIADGNAYIGSGTGSGAGKVVSPGRWSNALVQLVDLYDTILEIATVGGASSYNSADSYSLVPVLNQTTDVVRTYSYTEIIKNGQTQIAARNSNYKLIHQNDGSCELYNLSSDRWEEGDPLTFSKVVGPGGSVSVPYSMQQLLLGKMNTTLGLSLTCN